jgi:NAD(P)H-nitrite reductase large subunit
MTTGTSERRDGAAGEKALAVNVDAREVQTTARTLGWDALVFATGSTPFVPPIPGCDAPHVFTFRTLEDTGPFGNRRSGGGAGRRRARG